LGLGARVRACVSCPSLAQLLYRLDFEDGDTPLYPLANALAARAMKSAKSFLQLVDIHCSA